MVLDPLELAVIGAIILAFFLWGPQKIPEIAKTIGLARREFDNATKEFQKVSRGLQDGTSTLFAESPSPLPPPPAPTKTGDQLLIEAAGRLGISTQGKTREQIQEEIIAMAQRPGPESPKEPKKTP